MGNSSSKAEEENRAALNRAIDGYNNNALVSFSRFLSGDEKINHLSSSTSQNTLSARDVGFFTGGLGAMKLGTSLMYDNSQTNTVVYEFHNHGSGTQTFNFLNSI